MTSIFGSKSCLDAAITSTEAFSLALNMLMVAYGRDEADGKLIASACENIYTMGRAQGMNDALEALRKEWKNENV